MTFDRVVSVLDGYDRLKSILNNHTHRKMSLSLCMMYYLRRLFNQYMLNRKLGYDIRVTVSNMFEWEDVKDSIRYRAPLLLKHSYAHPMVRSIVERLRHNIMNMSYIEGTLSVACGIDLFLFMRGYGVNMSIDDCLDIGSILSSPYANVDERVNMLKAPVSYDFIRRYDGMYPEAYMKDGSMHIHIYMDVYDGVRLHMDGPIIIGDGVSTIEYANDIIVLGADSYEHLKEVFMRCEGGVIWAPFTERVMSVIGRSAHTFDRSLSEFRAKAVLMRMLRDMMDIYDSSFLS